MKNLSSLFILAVLFLFAACKDNKQNKTETTEKTVTITHALDTVQVPVNPERVVVLDFGALENLDIIGANIVGIPKTGLPDYLSTYGTNDSIVNLGNLVQVSLEKINELQPDLIITGGRLSEFYADFSEIAPTIMPTTIVDGQVNVIQENLADLGKIFGEKSTKLYTEKLDAINSKVKKIREKAKKSGLNALVVLHNRGRFSAYGSGSRFGLVHDALGIPEAKEGLETDIHGVRVSSEFIKKVNPDILFIVDRSAAIGDQPLNKADIENALIQKTNAYKNDKIVYLNPQAWYLSGGSGVTSLNIMLDEVSTALN